MRHPDSVIISIKSLGNQLKRLMAVWHPHRRAALTGMQHAVLGYVGNHNEDIFQRDIERHFNIRRSTATGILQLMEKNGLLRRVPVEHDLRLKRIVLTEQALQIHREAHAELSEIERRSTSGLSPGDLATFFRVLERISENIETMLADAESARPKPDSSEDNL